MPFFHVFRGVFGDVESEGIFIHSNVQSRFLLITSFEIQPHSTWSGKGCENVVPHIAHERDGSASGFDPV